MSWWKAEVLFGIWSFDIRKDRAEDGITNPKPGTLFSITCLWLLRPDGQKKLLPLHSLDYYDLSRFN